MVPALDGRVFEAALGTLELFSVLLGTRLGLYAHLAGAGPTTVADLAAGTGVDPRYLQEWCEQQAVAGYLVVDDVSASADTRRYDLPAGHVGVLVDEEDPAHVAPFAETIVGIAGVIDEVVEAYRTGAGVPYARYGASFRYGQGAINRPAFVHDLRGWVVAAELKEVLARPGARVADVGSGLGWSTITLADAFPEAEVVGIDSDPASVAEAKTLAEARRSRARFVESDGTSVGSEGPFDVIVVLEALHDFADPVGVLSACRGALRPGGAVVVADEKVADAFTAPGDELERLMYGWSITHCLPAARAEDPSAALGTVLRADTLRALAVRAGFADVRVIDVDAGFFRIYRLDG